MGKNVNRYAGLGMGILYLLMSMGCSTAQPDYQVVKITVVPEGATLKVGNKHYFTSAEIHAPRNQKLRIEASKDGYETTYKTVGYHLNKYGMMDMVGILFLYPGIGLFFPGSRSLDETDISIALKPHSGQKPPAESSASSGSSKTEGVDWVQFKERKIELSPDQAIAAVRSSLELMGRNLEKESPEKSGTFVLERLDRSGFAFKMVLARRVGNLTINADMPLMDLRFVEVTGLGIKKSSAGQETHTILMAGTKQLWELPFTNAAERDRLLSALLALCGNLTMK